MDGVTALHVERLHAVDGLSDDIHHATLDLFAGRHGDGTSRRDNLQATLQAVGVVHGHTTYRVFTDVLLHLDDQVGTVRAFHRQGFINLRQHLLGVLSLGVEIDIHHRANDLRDASIYLCHIVSCFKFVCYYVLV